MECVCILSNAGYLDVGPKSTAVIIVTTKEVLMIESGTVITKEPLPSFVQVPELSALTHTATMAVINNIAYFGGLHGIVNKIAVHEPEDKNVSLSISTVPLEVPCIAESFTYTNYTGVTASCFENSSNSLYVIPVRSPSKRRLFQLTDKAYISMIVPANDFFYYVYNTQLIKESLYTGHLILDTLKNCNYPVLVSNPYHYIVIQCENSTSKVYIPEEWSGEYGVGFLEGGWKDGNETLYPCYGTGFSPLVYSLDGGLIILYDIRSEFKQPITLKGSPMMDTLTCVLNGNQLILIYADKSCNCWMKHELNEDFEYIASYPIPGAVGILPPYSLENKVVSQKPLVFQHIGNVLYIMVPSIQQVLVDTQGNTSYSDITNDVIFFFGLYPFKPKGNPNKKRDDSSTLSKNWGLFVGGTIFIVIFLLVAAPFASATLYKLKKRWSRR